MNYNDFHDGIPSEFSESIGKKVVKHKLKFQRISTAKYMELLPLILSYQNITTTSIDPIKLEVGLMSGYDMVLGETNKGKLVILGYTNTRNSIENPINFITNNRLTKDDITFIIPESDWCTEYLEISNIDDCETGNFVVIRNKVLNYVSDYEIIDHYIERLGELISSRFSLYIQSKVSTFFTGEINDETMNKVIAMLYEGYTYIKTDKFFDPEDQMHTVQNTHIGTMLTELKREYQNIVSELNATLGINSLAVDKESGVSDIEAKSNRASVTANANIKIKARQNPFNDFNKHYGRNIQVIYDDDVASELERFLGGAVEK